MWPSDKKVGRPWPRPAFPNLSWFVAFFQRLQHPWSPAQPLGKKHLSQRIDVCYIIHHVKRADVCSHPPPEKTPCVPLGGVVTVLRMRNLGVDFELTCKEIIP